MYEGHTQTGGGEDDQVQGGNGNGGGLKTLGIAVAVMALLGQVAIGVADLVKSDDNQAAAQQEFRQYHIQLQNTLQRQTVILETVIDNQQAIIHLLREQR